MAETGDPGILDLNFQGGDGGEAAFSASCGSSTDQIELSFQGCAKFLSGCVPKGPEKGDVLAPWVLIEMGSGGSANFQAGGSKITVSNRSSPDTDPKHTAVIQSFEMGATDGLTVRCVIQDLEGGSLVEFVDNVLKDWNCLKGSSVAVATMKFQFGWVKSGCDRPYPTAYSPCYYAVVEGIDTSFSEGKFIAEISGTDIARVMLQGHAEKTQGDDGENQMCLMDAVTELLTNDVAPNVSSVKFQRQTPNGPQLCGFEFKEAKGCKITLNETVNGKKVTREISKGPKRKWQPSSRNKLETALSWMSGWSTDGEGDVPKGWVPQYNPEVLGGEVIFWEDAKPNCTNKPDEFFEGGKCLGVYTVNGGKNSNVLQFNPKIHWDFSRLVSGGGGVGDQGADPMVQVDPNLEGKSPGRRDCPTLARASVLGAGQPLNTTNTEVHQDKHGDQGQAEKQKAVAKQIKAFKVTHDDITAELVIIGDPTIAPIPTMFKYLTIIFINPFHLSKGTGCDFDWTALGPCNEVLSSKSWQIQQVIHKIELGKYTTHLTVFLPPVGNDGDTKGNLGLWTNGWRPKVCS